MTPLSTVVASVMQRLAPAPGSLSCPCCGRSWPSVAEMRAGTEHVGWQVDDERALELANCPCGSTRVVSMIDACPPTLRDPGLPP